MTIKTTRIDDLTGREITGLQYVEVEIILRRIGPSGHLGDAKVRRFHTENATILDVTKEAEPKEAVTATCLDFLRKLIRDELENAHT